MFINVKKAQYDSLSDSEKRVVDYLNKNETKIPELSITSLAKKTFTSSATVSRTIQKCGFSGISELRYNIMQQQQKKETFDAPYVVNNILAKSFRECTKTIDEINSTDIFQIVEFIKSARRIFICSRGFTALIAEELQMYLQLLGYNAIIVKDVMWMNKFYNMVTSEDTVIIISLRNSTPELAEVAKMGRTCNAKVVSICCKSNTSLEKYSNVAVIGHTEKVMNTQGLQVYSRIPLLIITRTIIEYIGL